MKIEEAAAIVRHHAALTLSKDPIYKEYSNDAQNLTIEIEKIDNTFDHAFGVERVINHEIRKIEAFIPALNEWLDVTHIGAFDKPAKKLLQEFIDNE